MPKGLRRQDLVSPGVHLKEELIAIAAELWLVPFLERVTLHHEGAGLQLLKVRTVIAVVISAPLMRPDPNAIHSLIGYTRILDAREKLLEHQKQSNFRAHLRDLWKRWNRYKSI